MVETPQELGFSKNPSFTAPPTLAEADFLCLYYTAIARDK
jgi:hypothetical protein